MLKVKMWKIHQKTTKQKLIRDINIRQIRLYDKKYITRDRKALCNYTRCVGTFAISF